MQANYKCPRYAPGSVFYLQPNIYIASLFLILFLNFNIVAAFQEMHVSPAKHGYV